MDLSFDNTQVAFAYKSTKELKNSRLLLKSMHYPALVSVGTRLTPVLLKSGLPVEGIIRKTIFRQFVGGETLEATKPVCSLLGNYNVDVILDYGVEGKETEEQFDKTADEFIRVIDYAASQPNIPFMSVKVTGLARFGLLEKLNEAPRLRSGIHDNEEQNAEWDKVYDRMYRICEEAAAKGVRVLVDAEESWIQDPVDRMVMDMMTIFNKEKPIIWNTLQLYRHDRLNFLELSHRIAVEKGFKLAVKLVRGAYMEKERARAAEMGYPSPIQPDKESTDRDYNLAVQFCLDKIENTYVMVASHNEQSNMLAAKWLDSHNLPHNDPHVFFSQLYGMSDNITFNLAKAGFSASKYLPFGPIKDVIPYLMRRAQENTSVSGQVGRELSLVNKEIERRKKG